MRKLFLAIGVILALLVATSIQSFAEDDIIYGCVGKAGKLRIVDDPSECRISETPIYWNVVGPQGPPGADGTAGADGICDCPITQEQLDDIYTRIEVLESKVPRFTDMGDGTIRDNKTGLFWLKDVINWDLPGAEGESRVTWDEATAAVAALEDGRCGLTDGSSAGDWRIPTITEFRDLCTEGLINGAELFKGDIDYSVFRLVFDSFPYVAIDFWTPPPIPGLGRTTFGLSPGYGGIEQPPDHRAILWPVRDAF